MQNWKCPIYNGKPWNLNLTKMWKIKSFFWLGSVYFWFKQLWIFALFLISKKSVSLFCREITNKMNSLNDQKHAYLIHTWLDKAFKGIVVNLTLPSILITWFNMRKESILLCLVEPVNLVHEENCIPFKHRLLILSLLHYFTNLGKTYNETEIPLPRV